MNPKPWYADESRHSVYRQYNKVLRVQGEERQENGTVRNTTKGKDRWKGKEVDRQLLAALA